MGMNLNILTSASPAPVAAPAPGATPAPAPAVDTTVTSPAPAPAAYPDWMGTLPEAYRQDSQLSQHQNMEAMLAEYSALKTNAGKSTIPDWNAPYEEHKDFFSKIGVPEKPEAYELKLPENFPESYVNKDFLGKMQAAAHKAKMPAEAWNGLLQEYLTEEMGAITALEQSKETARVEAGNTLAKLWGENSEVRSDFTRQGFGKFSSMEEAEALNGKEILEHPYFIHVMSKIGEAMKLPVTPGSSSTSGSGVQPAVISTPQQARDAIDAMWKDPETARILNSPKDPKHREMNAKVDALYAQTYNH